MTVNRELSGGGADDFTFALLYFDTELFGIFSLKYAKRCPRINLGQEPDGAVMQR